LRGSEAYRRVLVFGLVIFRAEATVELQVDETRRQQQPTAVQDARAAGNRHLGPLVDGLDLPKTDQNRAPVDSARWRDDGDVCDGKHCLNALGQLKVLKRETGPAVQETAHMRRATAGVRRPGAGATVVNYRHSFAAVKIRRSRATTLVGRSRPNGKPPARFLTLDSHLRRWPRVLAGPAGRRYG